MAWLIVTATNKTTKKTVKSLKEMEVQKQQKVFNFTGEQLAETLGVDWPTLYTALKRSGHKHGKDDFLSDAAVQDIIRSYSKPHARRDDSVVTTAQQIANQYNITLQLPERATLKARKALPAAPDLPPPPPPTDGVKAEPSSGKRVIKVVIYTAFVFILLFQIEHLAAIGMEASAFSDPTARMVSGWLFACTAAATAFLMTIERGTAAKVKFFKQSVSYLKIFALLDIIFFMLSKLPAEYTSLGWYVFKVFMVAITTAFCIYSYAELITTKPKIQT